MGLNRLMERIRMPIILVSGADEHGLHDGAGQQLARLAARWRERCADGHWRRRRIGMRYAMHAYREARAGGWTYYGGAIGCLSFIALQLGTLRRTGRLLRGRYPIARTWN